MRAFLDEVTFNDRGNEVTLVKRREAPAQVSKLQSRIQILRPRRLPYSIAFRELLMPTVLVVDDAAVDRKLVGGLLAKRQDLRVEFAASGDEALAKLPSRSGRRSSSPTW